MVLDVITEVTIVAKLGKSTVTIKIPEPRKEMGEVYDGLKAILEKRIHNTKAKQKSRSRKSVGKVKQITKNIPATPLPPEWTQALKENAEMSKKKSKRVPTPSPPRGQKKSRLAIRRL